MSGKLHSYWFLVVENELPDSTNNEMRQLMGENELRKLKDTEVMNDSSLRRYLGIDNERYLNMLLECKLLRKRGDKMIVSPEMWKQFFTVHKIEAEFEHISGNAIIGTAVLMANQPSPNGAVL